MSRVLKIFLKVIRGRAYKKAGKNISENQFGFGNGLGTRVALFAVQVLVQRCRIVNNSVYFWPINFKNVSGK